MAKAEIRMTEGPIAKQLVSFAIPLFLGFLFQQLYNTADALIVGNLLGNSALAAVTGAGHHHFAVRQRVPVHGAADEPRFRRMPGEMAGGPL